MYDVRADGTFVSGTQSLYVWVRPSLWDANEEGHIFGIILYL